jgi:hypothetical protein
MSNTGSNTGSNPGDDLNRFDIGFSDGSSSPQGASTPQGGSIPNGISNPTGASKAKVAIGPAKIPASDSAVEPIREPSKVTNRANKVSTPSASKPAAGVAARKDSKVLDTGSSGDDLETAEIRKKSGFWNAAPSWAISTVVHVAAILALAAWNIEPITKEISLLLNVGEPAGSESDALEEFSMDDSAAEMQTESEDMPSDVPTV